MNEARKATLICEGSCGVRYTVHEFTRREESASSASARERYAVTGEGRSTGWKVFFRCIECAAERVWGFEWNME